MGEPRGYMGMLTNGLHRAVTEIQETNARAVAKKMESEATTPTGRYRPKCGNVWNASRSRAAALTAFSSGTTIPPPKQGWPPSQRSRGGQRGRHGVFGAFSNRVRWRCWDALRGGKWVLGVSKRGGDGVVIFSLLQQRGSVCATRALRTGSCNCRSPDGSARGKAAGTGSTRGAAMAAAGLLAATASGSKRKPTARPKPRSSRKYEDFIDHDEDEEEDDEEEDTEDNGELSVDNDDDADGAAGELAAYERVC